MHNRDRCLGAARIFCGVSAIAISAAFAIPAAAQDAGAAELESVVVTASRIVRDGYEAPTPTTVVGLADLQKQSVSNIANYVNMLPQLGTGAQASPRSTNFAAGNLGGTNSFNMRNLGLVRTLTLFDGHRVVGSNLQQLVDVNLLPTNLISRVDVVTGGASAAWGSDAVAGVVNFVLDKTFTGVKGTAAYGQSWQNDGANVSGDLAAGFRFAGGRGHVLLSGRYEREDGIFSNASREWFTGYKAVPNTARTATNGQPGFIAYDKAGIRTATPGGMIVGGPLAGVQFGPGGQVLPYQAATTGSGLIGVGGDTYDIGPNLAITPDTRNGALFGRVSYDLTDNINAYVELSKGWSYGLNYTLGYMRFGDITIRADNPFIPAGLDLRGQTSFQLGRVMEEPGLNAVQAKNKRNQTRLLLGVDGKTDWFDNSFKWSTYYQHGETDLYAENAHNPIIANYNRAVDVVRNPASGGVPGIAVGTPVCRSTITNPTNGCQPLNLFGKGSPSTQAIDYVTASFAWQKIYVKQDVANFDFQFEPFSLPAGPLAVAAGAGYRKESFHNVVDPLGAANSGAVYWFGNYKASRGEIEVKEAFVEVVAPLLKDLPFVKSMDFNGAYRSTDYSTSGRVGTWKLGLTWDVTSDLRLRGTRSRDIRAANLDDLFRAPAAGALIGAQVPGTSQQVFVTTITGGVPTLTPEIASTTAFGLVYRPSFLPGFSVSVDRWKIGIDDAIVTQTTQQVVNACYGVGEVSNPLACNQINYNPNPPTPDLAGRLTNSSVLVGGANIARQDVAGWDIEASYRRDLADLFDGTVGTIDLRAVGTHLTKYTQTANGVTQDYRGMVFAGIFPIAGGPKWRWLITGTYSLGPSATTFTVRTISNAVVNNAPRDSATAVLQNDISARGYLDINQSWSLNFLGSQSQIFAKVENVLDTQPPKVPSNAPTSHASSGVNGEYYDLIGRYWRVGVRFRY
ncbi:TonB-dependent receptor domain-containing protein [Phenylobacterium immobile]|uniref:TonB-dependent receptor domain-containing protein n=1 Tax=Phenylobacterium immobile TaxID=21 RepID=UPI000AEC9CE6|nr:TonB-dependent receptor [Phenylobacterium immobile]